MQASGGFGITAEILKDKCLERIVVMRKHEVYVFRSFLEHRLVPVSPRSSVYRNRSYLDSRVYCFHSSYILNNVFAVAPCVQAVARRQQRCKLLCAVNLVTYLPILYPVRFLASELRTQPREVASWCFVCAAV